MKINKFGTVTLREGLPPLIEGWLVEREPEDPADATPEQLIVGFAIIWAEKRFIAAKNMAILDVFRKRRAAEVAQPVNPTTIAGEN